MGCSSLTNLSAKVQAPANLVALCADLDELPKNSNMGDLLNIAIKNNQTYIECADRHKTLAEWLK